MPDIVYYIYILYILYIVYIYYILYILYIYTSMGHHIHLMRGVAMATFLLLELDSELAFCCQKLDATWK